MSQLVALIGRKLTYLNLGRTKDDLEVSLMVKKSRLDHFWLTETTRRTLWNVLMMRLRPLRDYSCL